MRFLFMIVLSLLSIQRHSENILSLEDMIKELHNKHTGNYIRNISFIQIDKNYSPNGAVNISTSYECYHFPGLVRIDQGIKPGLDGEIYNHDSLFTYVNGKLISSKFVINNTLLLTGDIYFQPIDKTIEKMNQLGYKTYIFREAKYEGKDVYIIGAEEGDLTSPQVWFEKENHYLLRNILLGKDSIPEDYRYFEHEKIGNVWVENEIEVYKEGKLIRKESYVEVKADEALDLRIFQKEGFSKYQWHNK